MNVTLKHVVLLVMMLLSAGAGIALRPTILLADELPAIKLRTTVPTTFGDWQEQSVVSAQIVDPQQKAVIDSIYSETLSRTYVNSAGYHIMLSVAYGKNQSDSLQLHKPDICYPAQGFTLLKKVPFTLVVLGNTIPAVRIEASLGQRREPLTYWTVTGDHVTTTGLSKKVIELRYAMSNRIPDGMLVRVSSIDSDTVSAYAMQEKFVASMLESIPQHHRSRFGGGSIAN